MTQEQDMWNARVQAARETELMRRLDNRGELQPLTPKTGSLHPFKRAAKLYTEIMELRASWPAGDLFGLQLALGEFPPYVSRGHGWKGRIKNRTIEGIMNRHESKPYPDAGRSEAARRVFQRLPADHRALIREIEKEYPGDRDEDRRELEVGL